jgi:penicillin amidase
VPGLRADVRVTWTDGGLPHLDASNATDLLFAQGFLCAAERLFQMDLARRVARGELAEAFGDRPAPGRAGAVGGLTFVDLDHYLRQLALGPVAQASVDALSAPARALVDAYAAGVSAWLAEASPTLEHQLLGVTPRPWTASDCAILWKLLAFQLSTGWRAGLLAEALRARFPGEPEKVRGLLPGPGALDPALPPSKDAARLLAALEGATGSSPPGLGEANAWALSAKRSVTDRALLCGDLHVPLSAPAPGWLVHLTGGGLDVAGWSLPGVPGVVTGHTASLAWTLAAGGTVDSAWAREALSPDGRGVRVAKGVEPLVEESTEIAVNKGSPVRRPLRFSGNGPLFGAHLPGLEDARAGLALRWTGHLPTPDLEAILQLDQAQSAEDLAALVPRYGAPPLKLVHAGVDGRVGWRLAGLAPRFARGRVPLGAVAGWSEAEEWQGIEAPESLPFFADPPDGLVASAGEGGPPPRAEMPREPPYRSRRLRALLGGSRRVTLDEACAPQRDLESGFGLGLRDRFLRPLRERLRENGATLTEDARRVLDSACSWGGFADADSAGAAAAWTFLGALVRRLFTPLLGEPLFAATFASRDLPLGPLLAILEAGGAPFFTRPELDHASSASLNDAGVTLRARCGGPRRWRLGAIRMVTLTHPLSATPGLGRLWTIGPFESGGDDSTLDLHPFRLDGAGAADVGPVFRHAVECGDWDRYSVVLATGQGGDPANGRFREHVERWRAGGAFTFPFSPEAIAAAAVERAELGPG